MSLRVLALSLVLALQGSFPRPSLAATPAGATPERSSNSGAIVTTGIDLADCQVAANALTKVLLESKFMAELPSGSKPLIALSQVFNRTAIRQLNTRLISNKILDAINKDGRLEISQNLGIIADGSTAVVDDLGLGVDDLKRLRAGDKGIRIPDYTMSGEIIGTQVKSGKLKEFTYHFRMVIAKGNIIAWQDKHEIRKQVATSR